MSKAPKMTKQQRKALAAKVAKARSEGKSGNDIRDLYGEWLTGPVRRALLREFDHAQVIAPSYDRQAAKAKRAKSAA
jgi:hypothetical protein